MSAPEFTAGRWHAVGFWVEHERDDVADICLCDPADLGQGHLTRSDHEIAANARLMAASPDLYHAAIAARAALSELLTTRDPKVYMRALRALDAAIDKAEGKS